MKKSGKRCDFQKKQIIAKSGVRYESLLLRVAAAYHVTPSIAEGSSFLSVTFAKANISLVLLDEYTPFRRKSQGASVLRTLFFSRKTAEEQSALAR